MARTPGFKNLLRWLQGDSTPPLEFTGSLTRRGFLKNSVTALALGAACSPLGLLQPMHTFGQSEPPPPADDEPKYPRPKLPLTDPILIVGGGLAGLTTAYRLHQQGLPCVVFEATPRLGGRVFTKPHFNAEGMFCELGGELIDSDHDDLKALAKELGLLLQPVVPESMPSKTVYYFNGRVYTESELALAFKPLAKQMKLDLAKAFPDGEIETPTLWKIGNAQELDKLSLKDYLDSVPHLVPWVRRLVEVICVGEYGLEPEDQSALNLLLFLEAEEKKPFSLFDEGHEGYRILGGNGLIADRLASRLKEAGVELYTHHVLKDIIWDNNQWTLLFDHQGQPRTFMGTSPVVLTLPFPALRKVTGADQLPLSATTLQAIQHLGYGTNTKQIWGTRSRPWTQYVQGRPMMNDGFYTDLAPQCYWDTSRGQGGSAGIITNFLGGTAGAEAQSDVTPQSSLGAFAKVYPKVLEDLSGDHATMNWSQLPSAGGSYVCPKPGQYGRFLGFSEIVEMDGLLWFAGEHCSVDYLGYMNGAIESANRAASNMVKLLEAFQKNAVS